MIESSLCKNCFGLGKLQMKGEAEPKIK